MVSPGRYISTFLAARGRICSNPADSLYAVLGLVPEASWRDLPIDYAMPITELYARAASILIRSSRGLSILSFVGRKRREDTEPSQLGPRLASPSMAMPLDLGCSVDILVPTQRLVSFNASRGMRFHVNVQEPLCKTLRVQCIHYDTIQAVAEFEFAGLRLLQTLLDVITKLPRDRLWRTILANENVSNLDRGSRNIPGSYSARAIDGEMFVYLLSIVTWSMLMEAALQLPFEPPSDSQQVSAREIAQNQYDIYEKIVDPELICAVWYVVYIR